MRVNVSYSVELDEVLQTTAALIRSAKEGSLEPLVEKLEEALTLINKEDEKNAIRHLDDTRQELAKIDLRLLDCISILSGYQNVTTGNIEDFKAPKDSEDKSEKIDEKG